METVSRRSLRVERGSSLTLGRSNSSLLASELFSSEISKIGGYDRLSESMRLTTDDERCCSRRPRKIRALSILRKVFSLGKLDGHDVGRAAEEMVANPSQAAAIAEEDEEEKKKKRRSSWLPDPHRRWPVQGW